VRYSAFCLQKFDNMLCMAVVMYLGDFTPKVFYPFSFLLGVLHCRHVSCNHRVSML
jgi:hypothetical protein